MILGTENSFSEIEGSHAVENFLGILNFCMTDITLYSAYLSAT